MKKLGSLILALLLLVSCSNNGVTTITDKDEVLFMIEDTPVTKGQIYSMLRYQNISATIISDAQSLLIESSVELTDELKEEAKSNLEEAKEAFGDYFVSYYGEATDEEYLERIFYPAVQQQRYVENYYDENVDTIIAEDQPVKIQILYYADETVANEVATKLADGVSVADIIEEYGATNTAGTNSEEPLVTAKSALPTVVAEFIASEEGQNKNFSKSPLVTTDLSKYYLVKLIEDDSTTLKEEYREFYLADEASLQGVITKLFNEAKFEIYDQAIYDGIKNNTSLADFLPDN